jgi:D-tyrosyl-tRNA(Tyr) deacylase
MRAVVQRVTSSSVSVKDEIVGSIGPGLNVLLGIGTDAVDIKNDGPVTLLIDSKKEF